MGIDKRVIAPHLKVPTGRNRTVFGALQPQFPSSRFSWHEESDLRSPQRRNIQTITGIVKFFNADKGYGFIQPEDGSSDAFVHMSSAEAAGLRTLEGEQRATYDLENDGRRRASTVNPQAA